MTLQSQNQPAGGSQSTEDEYILKPDYGVAQALEKADVAIAERRQRSLDEAARFVERLKASFAVPDELLAHLPEISDRFLTAVGMVFRDEIPRDQIPRNKRLEATLLTIDWSTAEVEGRWTELGVVFPAKSSLEYCAETIAGAPEGLIESLSKQYLEDLREGRITPHRLIEVERTESSVTFKWLIAFSSGYWRA